jgi:hypothetical protein
MKYICHVNNSSVGLKGLVSDNLNPLAYNVWSNNPAGCCHIFVFLLKTCFHKVGGLFYDLGNGASDRVFMKAKTFFDG